MKKIALFVMSAAVLASSSAFAQSQGLTRADVRQQLVEAQQDGSQRVSNASYPDVARIYTNQVTQAKQGAVGLWRRCSRFERQLVALGEYGQPESRSLCRAVQLLQHLRGFLIAALV